MSALTDQLFWSLIGSVATIVSAIGAAMAFLVKGWIRSEARRFAEIHGAISAELLDKEDRLRKLESGYSQCATRQDIDALRREFGEQLTNMTASAERRHQVLVELVTKAGRRR